ncbi:MAG: alpha/beta fold hydrolase [Planctomycetes bacterium]|nr:alpha/beta fold hydrolase [Planctomycetota bacterium]
MTTVRSALLLMAIALTWWFCHADTWLVWLIFTAPCIRLAVTRTGRSLGVFLVTLAFGSALAVSAHIGTVHMLGGFIRPLELLWSAWFYTGCFTTLEGLDWALTKLLTRVRPAGLRSGVRLAIIVMLVLPLAVSIIETVHPKTGYTLPDYAADLHPTEFVTPSTNHVRIHGYYFDRGHDTTIIIAHGLGAHAENFMPFATALLPDEPINSMIIDLRAHGYSGGHTASFGYHETDDVLAALNWLRQTHPQAAKRIIFYGFSMGAAAAVRAAERTPECIGVILDSGYARLTEMAWIIAGEIPRPFNYYCFYTAVPTASALCQAPLWTLAPVDTVAKLHVPVHVAHGAADTLIPVSQGRELLKAPNVTGSIVPGGTHTNLSSADPAYFVKLGRFVELLMRPASSDAPSTPPQGPTIQAR